MPRLIIIRGLPGSGKTSEGHRIAKKTGALFLEPDMLLMHDGEYRYSQKDYDLAVSSMRAILGVVGSLEGDVIYADVLPTRADVQAIIDKVAFLGSVHYDVRVIALNIDAAESFERNVHHVRHEDIMRMERDWEAWEGEELV